MRRLTATTIIKELLLSAGIQVNGDNPWDIHVHNDELYARVLKYGQLGLGEAYMDKWWGCQAVDQFFDKVIRADLVSQIKHSKKLLFKLALLKFINLQTKNRAFEVGEKHYDLGNELFTAMLDSRMNYTCGYWKSANDLETAQRDKLELVCQKLQLKPGMRLLDIGCGFGALAKYAAQNFGVEVVGVTISKQQRDYAVANCAGLPVEIRLQDYRDLNEKFDRITSLGMLEHVGHLNYRVYMEIVGRCLSAEGLFLLHTIGDNISTVSANEWVTKYIFPNGMLPSIRYIGRASEGLLVMEDWHNFGADYDRTLMAWHDNFTRHWPTLKELYDERFYRMWNYYLLLSAGSFRARHIQVWQIVFSKGGVVGGYEGVR